MAQHYSDPRRADDPHALPDLEVWQHRHGRAPDGSRVRRCEEPHCSGDDDDNECRGDGWYWWACFPGCLPDSDPVGPFATKAEALADAREGVTDEG